MGKTLKDCRDEYEDSPKLSRKFRGMVEYQKQTHDYPRCRKVGKVSFPSEEIANNRIQEILNGKTGAKGGAENLRAFKCAFCSKWHLTKQIRYYLLD